MAYNVSSNFILQSEQKSPDVIRKFTIAGSDYSNYVLRWPKFKRKWDDIRPKTLSLKLANGDQGMNFVREDKTSMENECIIVSGLSALIVKFIFMTKCDNRPTDTVKQYLSTPLFEKP